MTVVEVELPVRRFTPEQAGAIVVVAGVGVGAGAPPGIVDPPSANRQAK